MFVSIVRCKVILYTHNGHSIFTIDKENVESNNFTENNDITK